MVAYETRVSNIIITNIRSQITKNDIDIYLASLIEDLKVIWEEGVEVFDTHVSPLSEAMESV